MPAGSTIDVSLTLLLAPVVPSKVAHEQDLKLTCWARRHLVPVLKPLSFISQRISFPHLGACKFYCLDTVLEKHRIKSLFSVYLQQMLFISCWFHCATQNLPWSFCRLPVVVDTYSNNISIQTSSGKYVCWQKIGWCFQARKAFEFLEVSGYLYHYLYLLILMVKRWLGPIHLFQWWIFNSWMTEPSACRYNQDSLYLYLGVTNIPFSKTVSRLSNPVCLDYGYTRSQRTV